MEANVKAIDLLKNELEEVKKEMLLAAIFGEREKFFSLKPKKKELEKEIEEYKNKK
jgi:hypothetical protein